MESTMPREARDGMTVVDLYRAHQLELVRLAVLLLGDRLAAEDAVAATLRAEAMTVTEESLRPAELPTRPRHRRMVPALIATAAAAAGAAAIVGAVAIASGPERESPPAHTSALPPVTSSTPAPTVGTSPPPVEPVCGTQKCHLVQSVRIGADTLELLAAPSQDEPRHEADWKVRVRGGATLSGAPEFSSWVTKDSLHCATVAAKPVCLLNTYYLETARSKWSPSRKSCSTKANRSGRHRSGAGTAPNWAARLR